MKIEKDDATWQKEVAELKEMYKDWINIKEKILQRRRQMLVHSFIYYWLDDNIVSDHKWQEWADELARLQSTHGTEWGYHDEDFAEWDGSSGAFLTFDLATKTTAHNLLKLRDDPGNGIDPKRDL